MPPKPPQTTGAPSQRTGVRQGITSVLGERMPKYNRLLDTLNQGNMIYTIPDGVGTHESNYVLGFGTLVVAAAGTQTQTQNAPRDIILRRYIGYNQLAIADVDFQVLGFTVEANPLVIGNSMGGGLVAPGSFYNPNIDLPVAGGCPIAVQINNTSAAGAEYCGGFSID